MIKLDPELERYATPTQWERLKAWELHGSQRNAAKALGCAYAALQRAYEAVKRKAARKGYSPEHGPGMKGLPEGLFLKRLSTYTDREGEIIGQWNIGEADAKRQLEMIEAMVESASSDVPRYNPEPAPDGYLEQLMVVIPWGDPHFGLYCWAKEVGDNYDLSIAKRDLCNAVDYLVGKSPRTKRCVIMNLGDFFHADNALGTTTKGTPQDVDSRLPEVIDVGVVAIRHCIEAALVRHETVEIINSIGNHDETLSMALSIMLKNIYENTSRVIVHSQPTTRHYIVHGKVMIGVTHGQKTKDRDLPSIMASERPEDWGRTVHRYFYRGHQHHDEKMEYNGCTVEQFRTLAAGDAYTVSHGWLTGRDMKMIVMHKEYGEVERVTCSIDLLRDLENTALS